MTTTHHLDADTARALLTLRDLTDPVQGPHAMQQLITAACSALTERWQVPVHLHRPNPVVPVADNDDRLGYPADAIARDARYSRYLSDIMMLRAHTSAAMPDLHARIAAGRLHPDERDLVLAVAGLTYRRDAVDRLHVGEPHQLDTWRLRPDGPPLTGDDLAELIDILVDALLPGRERRTVPREHPYTREGRQVDVLADDGSWVEVAECGLTDPHLLAVVGLPDAASGLALGLGLDRALMVRKGIDDIRTLRATDPRIARQMLDLDAYQPVSRIPAIVRDVSVATDEDLDDESLADDLDRTLSAEEGNRLRDRIYAALHQGTIHTWASETEPASDPRSVESRS